MKIGPYPVEPPLILFEAKLSTDQIVKCLSYCIQQMGTAIFPPVELEFVVVPAPGKFGGYYPAIGMYATSSSRSDDEMWNITFRLEIDLEEYVTRIGTNQLLDAAKHEILSWQEVMDRFGVEDTYSPPAIFEELMTLSLMEKVHLVEDWYDGPRTGIADFKGRLHSFRSLYLDYEPWNPDEDRFELRPVSKKLLSLSLEDHQLWVKWRETYQGHRISHDLKDEIRRLPEDLARHRELCEQIDMELKNCGEENYVVKGKFTSRSDRVIWTWKQQGGEIISEAVKDGCDDEKHEHE